MTLSQQRIAVQPARDSQSTARQLGQAVPWQPLVRPAGEPSKDGAPEALSRRRTPLSVVPAPARRSGRGFAALCIAVLVAALMAVLVTNITVSNRQYQMVSLKGEQLDLNQSNEVLRQQVEHLQAPQNLSAEARRLGMVNPGDIAAIDLATGAVTGTATAAEASDVPGGHVATPLSPQERQAAERAAEAAADQQAAERAAADQAAAEGDRDAAEQGATDQDAADQGAADQGTAEAEQDLNGGTIAAPSFAMPGD